MKRFFLISILLLGFTFLYAQNIGHWSRFEIAVAPPDNYQNPFTEVNLLAKFTRPDGSNLEIKGFYDGNDVWRVRIMPDQIGKWTYSFRFTEAFLLITTM